MPICDQSKSILLEDIYISTILKKMLKMNPNKAKYQYSERNALSLKLKVIMKATNYSFGGVHSIFLFNIGPLDAEE